MRPYDAVFRLVLFLAAVAYLILVFQNPVQIDEGYTYGIFVSEGLWTCLTFYPFPNNHVLYSSLCSLLEWIPVYPLWVMRSVNVVLLLIGAWSIKDMLERLKITYPFILLAVLIFICNAAMLHYTWQARGYMMVIVLSALAFNSLIRILHNPNCWRPYIGLSIFVALGLATIPSQVYFSVSIYMALLLVLPRERPILLNWFYSAAIGVIICMILYAPLFWVSGISSITSNEFVQRPPFNEFISQLPNFLLNLGIVFIGYRSDIIIYPLLFIAIAIYIRANRQLPLQKALLVSILLFLFPGVLLLIHQLIPFNRVNVYLLVPFILIIVTCLQQLERNIQMRGFAVALSLLIGVAWTFLQLRNTDRLAIMEYDYRHQAVDHLAAQKEVEKVFFYNCNACQHFYKLKTWDRRNNIETTCGRSLSGSKQVRDLPTKNEGFQAILIKGKARACPDWLAQRSQFGPYRLCFE